MDVRVWGCVLWTFTHAVAFYFDAAPPRVRAAVRGHVRVLFEGYADLLPCIHCRRSFRGFLDGTHSGVPRMDAHAALGPRLVAALQDGTLLAWTFEAHNCVNDKLDCQAIEKAVAEVERGANFLQRAALESLKDDMWRVLRDAERRRRPTLDVLRRRMALGASVGESELWCVLTAIALDGGERADAKRAWVQWRASLVVVIRKLLPSLATIAERLESCDVLGAHELCLAAHADERGEHAKAAADVERVGALLRAGCSGDTCTRKA